MHVLRIRRVSIGRLFGLLVCTDILHYVKTKNEVAVNVHAIVQQPRHVVHLVARLHALPAADSE